MWPGGARCAASFTFDFDAEEVWIGEDPDNAHRPGVLSQGTYGAKVAVPQLLALLERRGVRATFFVPGRVAERHPGRVEAIVKAGHELAHHGYTHTSPSRLSRDEEEAELTKGLEVLRSFSREVTGYRSPSWDFSPHTLGLLASHGFGYSSNMMDDVRPYRHDGSPLVEVPIQWILDDAPHFWFDAASWNRTIRLPREVRELWGGEIAGIRDLGGLAVLTTHPQIIGRPGRIGMLDELLGWVLGQDEIWVGTGREAAGLLA